MILAIDIGNSNIVLGCIEGKEILKEARIATDTIKTSDQYCVELKSILDLLEIDTSRIEGTIISSVVPPVLNSFKTAIRKLTGRVPLVVGPGIKTGLNILLDNPALAGGDLIVGAVAALAEYPTPLLIIDMGTATTITAIDQKGITWAAAFVLASRSLPRLSVPGPRSSLPSVWRRRRRPLAGIPLTVCGAA